MSPEFAGGDDAFELIECRDDNGRELFPAADLNAARLLARQLEPELVSIGTIDKSTEDCSLELESIHVAARNLQRASSSEMHANQRMLQTEVMGLIFRENRMPPKLKYFSHITLAVRGLVPEEFGYFENIIKNRGRMPTDEDFIRAGEFDRSIAPVTRGKALGVRGNTEESLVDLAEIGLSYNSLIFTENQIATTDVLFFCMAYGEQRQVKSAINILKRFEKNAHKQQATQRNEKQLILAHEASRLGLSIVDGQRDGNVVPRAVRLLDSHQRTLLDNCNARKTLASVIYGREFRLNGNTHPEPVAEQNNVSEENPAEVAPETAVAPKPKPEKLDLLPKYTAKLQEIVSSSNPLQPECLPTKEIKRRGLDGARAVLVKGETDKDGNMVVAGRSKSSAQKYISNIEFLRGLIEKSGGNIAEAKGGLGEAAEAADGLIASLNGLTREAATELDSKRLNELKKEIPDVISLTKITDDIKNDWDAAAYVMREYWPNGAESAENLRQLLFLSKEEIESMAEETTIELPKTQS